MKCVCFAVSAFTTKATFVSAESGGSPDVGADIIGSDRGKDAIGVVIKSLSGSNRLDSLKGAAAMGILYDKKALPGQAAVMYRKARELTPR